jgi:hypothetical protein
MYTKQMEGALWSMNLATLSRLYTKNLNLSDARYGHIYAYVKEPI